MLTNARAISECAPFLKKRTTARILSHTRNPKLLNPKLCFARRQSPNDVSPSRMQSLSETWEFHVPGAQYVFGAMILWLKGFGFRRPLMKEIGALILWCKGYSLIEGGFIRAGVHLVEGLRFTS